jgi:magnesium chelatase family protein
VLVRAHSFAVDRGAAGHVDIELDLRAGLPGLAVIGLGGGAARDLRERVQAAVLNSGFGFPRRGVTVNVAPATPRGGAELDLAVACCVLAASGELDPARLERIGLCAELSLGGELRSCGAAAAVADAAAQCGVTGLLVARADRESARLPGGVPVAGLHTLRDAADLLGVPEHEFERACALTPTAPFWTARPRPRTRAGSGALRERRAAPGEP